MNTDLKTLKRTGSKSLHSFIEKRKRPAREFAMDSNFPDGAFYLDVKLQLPIGGFFSAADEFGVKAGLLDQFVVPALLNDSAAVEHENLVGAADGFQPVGDHENGLAVRQDLNGLLQAVLVLRVNVGRRFIQNVPSDRMITVMNVCAVSEPCR